MLKTLRSTLVNTLIYSFGTLASKLIGFFLLPLYTTKLSVSEYGVLGILEISSQFLIAFFGLSLYSAYFRWYWDKRYASQQGSILFTIMSMVLGFSLIFLAIFWPQADSISQLLLNTTKYSLLVRLVLVICMIEAQNILILTLLRLQEKAVFYTGLTTIKFTLQLVLTIYFMVYQHKKIEGIYLAQLISDIVFSFLGFPYLLRNIRLRFEFSVAGQLLKYSLPLILTSILGIILTTTDRYTLKFLSTLKDVGIYSLGYKISNFLRVVIVSSVQLALSPVLYRMIDAPGNKRFYSKVMTYYTFGLLFFVLGLSFFGKEVVKVMARQVDYWEAFSIIPIITYAILFSALKNVALIGINIRKKTHVTAKVTLLIALVNLGLNFLSIPKWGYLGAAAATLVSQILYFVVIYRQAQKIYYIPYEIKKIALALGVGILLIILSQIGNSFPLLLRLLYKTCLIILFPLILYPFNFYEKIELEKIREIFLTWRNPLNWKNNFRRLVKSKADHAG